jgi:hypothetical protein
MLLVRQQYNKEKQMMYKNNLVATIKSDGKVLREFNDIVYLPFGSEYSIYISNLNSRRAKVKVSIDGEDVLNNSELVLNANNSLDLERFVKDNSKGNRFKFIERTSKIENHRGIKAEDGLVRIEFAFERNWEPFKFHQYIKDTGYRSFAPRLGGQRLRMRNSTGDSLESLFNATCSNTLSNNINYLSQNSGITVKGSESNQKFTNVSDFSTDTSDVIVLKLVGDTGQNLVTKPITTKVRITCPTCGTSNKTNIKYCPECGTVVNAI